MTDDLTLSNLHFFNGTTQYHKIPLFSFANLTDGVIYAAQNGYRWFITDALSVIACDKKIREESFLSINLKLFENKDSMTDSKKAKMIITDGNNKTLYTQNYNYTSAKKELQLFYTNNVLMLSGEY